MGKKTKTSKIFIVFPPYDKYLPCISKISQSTSHLFFTIILWSRNYFILFDKILFSWEKIDYTWNLKKANSCKQTLVFMGWGMREMGRCRSKSTNFQLQYFISSGNPINGMMAVVKKKKKKETKRAERWRNIYHGQKASMKQCQDFNP